MRAVLVSFEILLCAASHAQFIAFNDGGAGPGTHTNATTYGFTGPISGFIASGPLKEISTGTNLPVLLSITNGGAIPGGAGSGSGGAHAANPQPGTPAFATFSDFVDFSPLIYSTRSVSGNYITAHVFSGLDSTKEYSFHGTMNAARDDLTFYWTLVEIFGAESFSSAHSSGCFTMAEIPELKPTQVVINLAANSGVTRGDLIAWESIHPGADGSFAVYQSQYSGVIPGGTSDHMSGVYVFGAIRLEEKLPPASPKIISHPRSRVAPQGTNVSFAVGATGSGPLGFQWRKNGISISQATNTSLTLVNVGATDSGNYSVTVSNANGSKLSHDAFLTVYQEGRLPLLSFADTWKYDQSGRDLGTGWGDDFDDSGWLSGRGVFGFGNSVSGTTLSQTNSTGGEINTYYFRSYFNLPINPEGVTLLFTNLIDDGAIIYLNGEEIIRWNMPDGKIDATTTVTSIYAVQNKPTCTTVLSAALRAGTNILAAEVHQNRNDLVKDLTFGLSLTAAVGMPEPLTLSSSPSNRTVNEHAPTAFAAGIDGSQPRFQWFHNNQPIPDATGKRLVFEETRAIDVGSYFVVASNSLNVVTSQVASLTVIPDSVAPLLISATRFFLPEQITLSFSEAIDPVTAAVLTNYVVSRDGGGERLTIVNASVQSETNVVLTVTGATIGAEYFVSVSGVRDTASTANLIAAGTQMPLTNRLPLIAIDALWKFYTNGTDPGMNWARAGYDDGSWPVSAAVFYTANMALSPALVYSGITNTLISRTSTNGSQIPTHYFRKHFNYVGTTNGTVVTVRHLLSDGAVYYLNGAEILRIGVPEGPLSYTNWATRFPPYGRYEGPFQLPVTNLCFGDNLLAVEVHHLNGGSLATFGAEVFAEATSLLVNVQPLSLLVGRSNNNVEIHWNDSGAWLQNAVNANGSWTTLTNVSPFLIGIPSNVTGFFRLRR